MAEQDPALPQNNKLLQIIENAARDVGRSRTTAPDSQPQTTQPPSVPYDSTNTVTAASGSNQAAHQANEAPDPPQPVQQSTTNDGSTGAATTTSALDEAAQRAGNVVSGMLEGFFEWLWTVLRAAWSFLAPIILGVVGRMLFVSVFVWFAFPAMLRSAPIKNAICTIPLVSYVPVVENFYHCTSMTKALAVYGEAAQDLAELDSISIQLLTPASTFILGEQVLTDASTLIAVSDFNLAGEMSDALDIYASDIATLGKGLADFFNHLMILMELMAINLGDISHALAEHKQSNIFHRFFSPRSDIIDTLTTHLDQALGGAVALGQMAETQLLLLDSAIASGSTVKSRQWQSLKEVRRALKETWTHPMRTTAWYQEYLDLEQLLLRISTQSLEPLTRTLFALKGHIDEIIRELKHVRKDILDGSRRFVSSEAQVRFLAQHARSLLEKAGFMKQTQRAQHAKMLAEINKQSHHIGL